MQALSEMGDEYSNLQRVCWTVDGNKAHGMLNCVVWVIVHQDFVVIKLLYLVTIKVTDKRFIVHNFYLVFLIILLLARKCNYTNFSVYSSFVILDNLGL